MATAGSADNLRLEGINHVTAITGDAPLNVDFYTRVLGLRLVTKTVNQDDPTVYHLFYADEAGSAGADLTFFEYPGAARGRAGAGMAHRVVWRVGSPPLRSVLGRPPLRPRVRSLGRGGRCPLRRPRGPRSTSCASTRCPTRRFAPITPRYRPSTPSSVSPACASTACVRRRAAACSSPSSGQPERPPGRSSCADAREAERSPSSVARGTRSTGRGHDPPRRLGHDGRGAPALARSPEARDRQYSDHRSTLLSLDLLPRARRRALRDRRRRPRVRARRPGQRARPQGGAAAMARGASRRHRGTPDAASGPASSLAAGSDTGSGPRARERPEHVTESGEGRGGGAPSATRRDSSVGRAHD